MYKFILPIVKLIKNNPEKSIKELVNKNPEEIFDSVQINYLIEDIQNVYEQLKKNELKENINWGIHPDKCIAIPYMNKDKPLLKSNFSSSIITVFLTLYYYIITMDYHVNTYLTNFFSKI